MEFEIFCIKDILLSLLYKKREEKNFLRTPIEQQNISNKLVQKSQLSEVLDLSTKAILGYTFK